MVFVRLSSLSESRTLASGQISKSSIIGSHRTTLITDLFSKTDWKMRLNLGSVDWWSGDVINPTLQGSNISQGGTPNMKSCESSRWVGKWRSSGLGICHQSFNAAAEVLSARDSVCTPPPQKYVLAGRRTGTIALLPCFISIDLWRNLWDFDEFWGSSWPAESTRHQPEDHSWTEIVPFSFRRIVFSKALAKYHQLPA